jgi:D-alanyl-D-alanine carboxypeptidase/D-alanyl-D-alanine-endopeptidase (penicillin-binding protein 4)
MIKTGFRAATRFPVFLSYFLAFLGLLVVRAAVAAGLPASVVDALDEAGISAQNVAVLVRSVDGDVPLIDHNATQPMNPASVMKLLTTYAALELLGPAHTWKTEALGDRLPVDGRLEGNLYLRGSGDPSLTLERFWRFLRQLRARGVIEIDGDLVLDRRAFSLPPHDAAEFDDQPLRPYNAGPDALLVDQKSLHFTLRVNTDESRVEIHTETPGVDELVDNRLTLGRGACGDWRKRLNIGLKGEVVVFSGVFRAGCGDKALYLSPWPADFQVERLFRALWQEMGGTLRGRVREGEAPDSALVLAAHRSPALAGIIREINKYSSNVMARQVFLALDTTRPATLEGARRAVETWLSGKGAVLPELMIDNGSGLSRRERISSRSLARLLLAAWQSPVMPEFMASLPLAGVDGTLKKRLNGAPPAGRAHLKTGYLEHVRTLAGYALDGNGKRWIVVFLINDPNAHLGKPAMDTLLRWLVISGQKTGKLAARHTG